MNEPPKAETASDVASALPKRTLIVGVGTLTSRLLGLLRDVVLAKTFAASETDLFFVAFTIPNAFRQLLAEGALSSAFVPVLTEVETKEGHEAARNFYRVLRTALWLVLVAVCALCIVFARPLMELFGHGFHERSHDFDRAVTLTKVVFPYLFFMGLAALGAGALSIKKRFMVAAFAPGLLNVAMILGALLLPAYLAMRGLDPLLALSIAAIIGGLLQVLAQSHDVHRAGFDSRFSFKFRDERLWRVIKRMGPMTIGLMIYEVDLVLSRRYLSELPQGSNSYFYYAQRLCDFPQGVFALALATAALPSLARLATNETRDELTKAFEGTMRMVLYVSIPASILFMALCRPIVVAIFSRGAFTATSVDGTVSALIVQAAGIVIVSMIRQLVPLYYVLADTKTPVIISAIDLLAFIAIANFGTPVWGHVAVSAAVTGSAFVQWALLMIVLPKKLPNFRFANLIPTAWHSFAASIFAAVFAYILLQFSHLVGIAAGALCSVAFGAIYLLACHAVGHPEQAALGAKIYRRLRR